MSKAAAIITSFARSAARGRTIRATFNRQRSQPYPYAFRPGTWNGANLFTTDLSHCQFFCTNAVVDCARKHKLTNFRFVPVEEGANSASAGLDYT